MKLIVLQSMLLILLSSMVSGFRAEAQSYNLMPPTTQEAGYAAKLIGLARATVDNDGQKNGLRVTVEQADGIGWHVELVSPPVQLYEGMTYTLSFVARASAPAECGYKFTVSGGDYHTVGLGNSVTLTTAWHKYRATFKLSGAGASPTELHFSLGNAPGNYWISSVRLVQGAPLALAADSADPGSWLIESSGGAQATMARDGDALKVTTTAVDGTGYHAQVYQSGVSLVDGQTYIISMDIKADRLEDVAMCGTTMTSYSNAGLGQVIHAAPTWQHVSYTFKAQNIRGELTRLPDLDIGGQVGIIWVKNVTLETTESNS